MDLVTLRNLYETSVAVKAICDHMAERANNQTETLLHRMIKHLQTDGHDFRRSEVISAFRELEGAECGRYIEGRRGWKSRFVWSVRSKLVAGAISGDETIEDLEEDEEAVEEDLENRMIEHVYVLRPDLTVTIELPADLTRQESRRVSQFVDSLSFEE